jgi:Mg-chelatase subunit ChlD
VNVTFLASNWLWLLLAVPLVGLVRSRVRVPMHAWLRALVLAMLVVGLARPVLWTHDDRERAVFVVDLSASVAPAQRDQALAALRTARAALPSNVVASLITFGGDDERLASAFTNVEHVASDGSSLSSALAAAARAIPDGCSGSVTIVSDGCATDQHWGDALIALEERGLPVHTLALAPAPKQAEIESFSAPHTLRIGHGGELVVELTGDAPLAKVHLLGPDGELAALDANFANGRGRVTFAWEPYVAGFVALEARVDANGSSQSLKRTFAVQDPLRALYLGQHIAGGADKLSELVGPGVHFETWNPSDANAQLDLGRYDLAVLDDMPAEALGREHQRALKNEVLDRGLGLFASGGEAAFGPGGYHDSELSSVLPVESVQKEEKRDPSTTLVLIIDTSGSMMGERIQLAKEVARLAMSRLLPHDKVGIVEFYGAKRWAAPIQPASNSIDLQRAINRMDAGGGTVILPAIEEAFYGMQNVQTRYKHVLVITDGGVENGAFEPLLRRMADEGMNVSTVLVGAEAHSEFLVNIANWGKGRFYSVPDRFNLPEILFKQPTSSRLPAYKPGHFPLVAHGGAGWWGEVERANVPAIAGYVETATRPGAEVLIEIEGERDPLLATWRYGLGTVTTLATEPVGPGTEPWRAWSGYGPLLARVLSRTADDGRAKFDFAIARRGVELELTARRRHAGHERPSAQRVDAANAVQGEFAFRERADGVFVARFSASPADEVRVLGGVVGDANEPLQRLCSNPRADEVAETAVDARRSLDLARVAGATGGDIVSLANFAKFEPRSGGANDPLRLRELAPLAFALSLALYLFEIFHRRRDQRRAA